MAASALDDVKESKKIFAQWCGLINREDRYYFSKAIDLFYALPSSVQYEMLKFYCESLDKKKWLDKCEDETQYIDVVRGLLYHFSGREDAGQPSKKEFGRKLAEFLGSKEFKKLESSVHKEKAEDFMEELGEV